MPGDDYMACGEPSSWVSAKGCLGIMQAAYAESKAVMRSAGYGWPSKYRQRVCGGRGQCCLRWSQWGGLTPAAPRKHCDGMGRARGVERKYL